MNSSYYNGFQMLVSRTIRRITSTHPSLVVQAICGRRTSFTTGLLILACLPPRPSHPIIECTARCLLMRDKFNSQYADKSLSARIKCNRECTSEIGYHEDGRHQGMPQLCSSNNAMRTVSCFLFPPLFFIDELIWKKILTKICMMHRSQMEHHSIQNSFRLSPSTGWNME